MGKINREVIDGVTMLLKPLGVKCVFIVTLVLTEKWDAFRRNSE